MHTERFRGITFVLALVMFASACVGAQNRTEDKALASTDDDLMTSDGVGMSDRDEIATDAQQASGGQMGVSDEMGLVEEPQTLDEFLGGHGLLSFDPRGQADAVARARLRVEEATVECMAREGFEYIPAVVPVDDFDFDPLRDVELARERGFGISTRFGEPEFDVEDDWVDPNEAIVESLSESERAEYNLALHGNNFLPRVSDTDGDADSLTGNGSFDDGTGGCSYEAVAEVLAVEEIRELLNQLGVDEMSARIEADPRTVQYGTQWSECMAERGFEYENLEALLVTVYGELGERLSEITGTEGGIVDPFQGMSREETEATLDRLSPEELEDFFAQAEERSRAAVDDAALAALQAEERALAVATVECTVPLYERSVEVIRQYEAEFVNENRAALEQFRASRER